MNDQVYGKSPENPIQLNSIPASRFYLNHLVTPEGYHLVYHRPGSLPAKMNKHPIDHYEIMTADNRYEDLFINIYNETNTWVPPNGFLFCEKIMSFPDGLNEYEMENINEQNLNIDLQYIYIDKSFDDLEVDLESDFEKTPILDLFLGHNFGVNSRVSDFPNAIIIQAIDPEGSPEDSFFEMLLSNIKPRGNTPNYLLNIT